ncbi:WD40-repeat-containing domain protein [Suillus ampliporus]|nr:WD40-repeat-containing domain protein [Suillus ampliporus]
MHNDTHLCDFKLDTHNLPTKSTSTVLNTVNLQKMAQLVPSTIPIRVFEYHEARVSAVAVFPDRRRMVTASYDKMLRLWDLMTGVVVRKMEGHRHRVQALAVSRDGRFIASGDTNGELFTWNGENGERLRDQAISAHTGWILSLDFSPDGRFLASGSSDFTVKLWITSTWNLCYAIQLCGANTVVRCVRYSPGSALLAIATEHNIQIHRVDYNSTTTIYGGLGNYSLAWTPNGKRLLSGGHGADPTIREWDSSTWQQVGDPLKGHLKTIRAISLNSNGTLLATASHDNYVRLWRLSDRRTIAVFKHSGEVNCVTFSADGRHILSGGVDKKISEWPASEDALLEVGLKDGLMKMQVTRQAQAYSDCKACSLL